MPGPNMFAVGHVACGPRLRGVLVVRSRRVGRVHSGADPHIWTAGGLRLAPIAVAFVVREESKKKRTVGRRRPARGRAAAASLRARVPRWRKCVCVCVCVRVLLSGSVCVA
jgi:hypothetical protein